MPLVRPTGFAADTWFRVEDDPERQPHAGMAEEEAVGRILPLARALQALEAGAEAIGLDLPNDAEPEQLETFFGRIALIAVDFPAFADGRGFSIGQRLRALGYRGALRASGGLIPDQFAYALVCGFDEVEIDDARAARQPEAQWLRDVGRPGWYQRALTAPGAA
ncbi:MAG: DUF934 domain-containing protein [Pseudomonadota bacterium]